MARRKRQEEHENHERWLVSYADFITLLFAFFVVMYSISVVNEGKYRVLSETLKAVFSEPVRSEKPIQLGEISRGQGRESPSPGDPPEPPFQIELPELPHRPPANSTGGVETIQDLSQQFTSALSSLIDSEDVIITEGEDWLELEIKSRVLFKSGESRLERDAVPVIGQIADILKDSDNPIQVEGFTDNKPINTPRFPSNWELSAARAASVVHLLDRYGLDPERMSATGYGEHRPIADNSTAEGRQKNRRVVLVVLGQEASRRNRELFNADTQATPESVSADKASDLQPGDIDTTGNRVTDKPTP